MNLPIYFEPTFSGWGMPQPENKYMCSWFLHMGKGDQDSSGS